MNDNTLKLYQAANSPNARRVRIFLAEKGLDIPLILVDLGKGGQRSECIASLDVCNVWPGSILIAKRRVPLSTGRRAAPTRAGWQAGNARVEGVAWRE
jgi:hypothetical protein